MSPLLVQDRKVQLLARLRMSYSITSSQGMMKWTPSFAGHGRIDAAAEGSVEDASWATGVHALKGVGEQHPRTPPRW